MKTSRPSDNASHTFDVNWGLNSSKFRCALNLLPMIIIPNGAHWTEHSSSDDRTSTLTAVSNTKVNHMSVSTVN